MTFHYSPGHCYRNTIAASNAAEPPLPPDGMRTALITGFCKKPPNAPDCRPSTSSLIRFSFACSPGLMQPSRLLTSPRLPRQPVHERASRRRHGILTHLDAVPASAVVDREPVLETVGPALRWWLDRGRQLEKAGVLHQLRKVLGQIFRRLLFPSIETVTILE